MGSVPQIKNNSILIGLLAILFLLVSIVNFHSITTELLSNRNNTRSRENSFKLKAFEKVDKALEKKTRSPSFSFDDTIDSPFQKLNMRKIQRRSGKPIKKKIYIELSLKGTLNKRNPLAIIEDENGKTFICKEGDKVHGRLIYKISEDKVIIKDAGKQTILLVTEK